MSLKFGNLEEKLEKVDTKIQSMDEKQQLMDIKLEKVDKKIERLDVKQDDMDSKLDAFLGDILDARETQEIHATTLIDHTDRLDDLD